MLLKHKIDSKQRAHLARLGILWPWRVRNIRADAHYREALARWKRTLPDADSETLHLKALGHVAWKKHAKINWKRRLAILSLALVLLVLLLLATRSHAQFSKINTISVTDGTTSLFTASPFSMSFSGCSVSGTGTNWHLTCVGVAGNPGGSPNQLQFNSAGTTFGGVGGIVLTASQPGATADVQISNAITALGGSGTVWANYTTSQTWAACPTWGTGNLDLVLFGVSFAISANCDVPQTVTLSFRQGAQFAPASGKAVTASGAVTAGPRQQIVNTANGTVSFYGMPWIYCGWYGSLQDLVHDDAPGCQSAHDANPGKFVYLTPVNPHCASGIGGGCLTAGPDALFLSQLLLRHNGSGFGFQSAYHKLDDGAPWIKVPNLLGTPAVFVGGSCGSCELENLFVEGPTANGWVTTDLTTFEQYSEVGIDGLDNDGITIAGGHFTGRDIGAANFLRHGIFLCGNSSCADGTGAAAAVDYWYLDGCSTWSNRGFGIFIVGGDGGGGKSINCGAQQDGYGAIGDWTGAGGGQNTHYSPGDEFSARAAIAVGATQAVSSISVTGGTCTLTTAAALANGVNTNKTWIIVAGSSGGTNFNGTFRVTSFNNIAQTLTYPCNSTGGPASGGTVGTQSSRGVWDYLATIYSSNGTPVTPGYSFTTGLGQVIFLAPYSEPAPTKWGSGQTMVVQGQNSQGFFNTGQLGLVMQSSNTGFSLGLPANPGGSALNLFGLQDAALNLSLQNGITADQDSDIDLYSHPTTPGSFGPLNWRLGQWLTGRYFRITQANNGNFFFLADKQAGHVILNGVTAGGDLQLQNNGGSGHVKFYGGGVAVQVDVGPTGTIDASAGTGGLKIKDQGSCTMAAGTCSAQTLGHTYAAAPNCFATWNGTGTLTGFLKVPSTTTTTTPASSVGTDTAVVNWFCLGS